MMAAHHHPELIKNSPPMSFRRVVAPFAACCLSVVVFAPPLPAFADTYTTYVTSADNSGDANVGLTSSGTVVLDLHSDAYEIFTPPNSVTITQDRPSLSYDNGTPCTPTNTGSFSYIGMARCNGSFEVFEGSFNGVDSGLYTGGEPIADLLLPQGYGGFDDLLINSEGDIAAVGIHRAASGDDRNYLFIRSQTPEPSSVALLGTGLLSMAGVVRRRVGTRVAV